MKPIYKTRWKLLAGSVVSIFMLSSFSSAFAQEQQAEEKVEAEVQKIVEEQVKQPEPEKDEAVEEVYVTGSRIKRSEFSSSSPITVITSERSTLAGLLDTSDILQNSTVAAGQQIDDSFSGFVTDGGPGANSISLRGLGAQRTLVLVNGRRWGPSGVRGSVNSVDLTAIPSSLISRVEILKDGASSVYGADAVAGVINVITKTRQDGLEIQGTLQAPFDGGGEAFNLNGIWGKLGSDWSVNVAADFTKQQELVMADRDWSKCTTRPRITDEDGNGTIDNRDPATGEELCFGAIYGFAVTPVGFSRYDPSLTPGSGPANPNFDPLLNGQFGIPFFTRIPENTLDNSGPFYRDNSRNPSIAQMVSESDVVSLTSFGEKDIELFDRSSTAFYEFYYNSRKTRASFGNGQLFPVVPGTNPSNPFGVNVQPVIMSWNVSDPNTKIDIDRFQVFTGLKGDLTEKWSYETYVGFSKSEGTYKSQRILDDRLRASLDAVLDANGNLVCRDPNAFGGCIAANWFTTDAMLNGTLPADYVNFISKNTVGNTDYSSTQFAMNATGDLFEMPAGSAQAVIGLEVRRESIDDQPDPEAQRNNIYNFSTASRTKGDDTVREVFTELELPLLGNKPFAEELTLNLAGRYTDYDSYGSDTTHRVQLNWQVNPSIRFRATNGTSFRAPDLYEQFLGDQTGFVNVQLLDPCINYGRDFQPGDIAYENCASLGLAPDFGSEGAPSARTVTGGNPDLKAETSESSTLGFIITPDNTNLSIALNYFEIELENSVASPSVNYILSQCYGSKGFSNPFCSRISPRSASGFLTDIDASLLNIGKARSKGVDLDVAYSKEFEKFTVYADFSATKISEQYEELLGTEYNYEGRWGFPEWSAELDLNVDWKDWRFLWSVNYIGETEEEPVFDRGTTNRDRINKTDKYFNHTLSARYTSPNDWQIIASLRNVFDEEPPIVSDGQGSNSATRVFNTLPGTGYDLLGRTLVLRFSKGF